MRASEVVLGLAVVGCVVLLLARDGGENAAIRDLGARMDGVEDGLAEVHARLAALQPVRPSSAPPSTPLPTSPKASAPAPGEVERWIRELKEGRDDEVFQSTIELARLGSMEAVNPLIATLEAHRDFYARLGAATALGELRAANAVPSLIEALDDKDELVRTAAVEALRRITGRKHGYRSNLARARRLEIQGTWRVWWAENESAVRAKLDGAK